MCTIALFNDIDICNKNIFTKYTAVQFNMNEVTSIVILVRLHKVIYFLLRIKY